MIAKSAMQAAAARQAVPSINEVLAWPISDWSKSASPSITTNATTEVQRPRLRNLPRTRRAGEGELMELLWLNSRLWKRTHAYGSGAYANACRPPESWNVGSILVARCIAATQRRTGTGCKLVVRQLGPSRPPWRSTGLLAPQTRCDRAPSPSPAEQALLPLGARLGERRHLTGTDLGMSRPRRDTDAFA
jgi:hypothetical protein